MGTMSKSSQTEVCACVDAKQHVRQHIVAGFALCTQCAKDLDRVAHNICHAIREERRRRGDKVPICSRKLKEHLGGLLDALQLHEKSGCCDEHQQQRDMTEGDTQRGNQDKQSLWLAIDKRGQWRLQLTKDEATKFGYEVVNEEEVQQMVDYIRRARDHTCSECEPRAEKPIEADIEEMDVVKETPVTDASAPPPPSSPEGV